MREHLNAKTWEDTIELRGEVKAFKRLHTWLTNIYSEIHGTKP